MLRIAPAFASLTLASLFATSFPAHAVDINASADTFVDGANTTTRVQNYGTMSTLRIRNSGQRLTLVRFTGLPTTQPTHAELRIRVNTVNVPGSVEIRRITSDWAETSVTFNTRPTIATATIASRNVVTGDLGTVITFDVSALVQSWVSAPSQNFGLAIVASGGSPAQVYFNSRETSVKPLLRINAEASDNEVTVAPSGADYTNPVTAAQNAYEGDSWCVNPTDSSPCIISIANGIYFLAETFVIPIGVTVVGGSTKGTILISQRGVETAVILDSRHPVTDLTVIHEQPDIAVPQAFIVGTRADARSELFRLAIRIGGGTNRVTAIEHFRGDLRLIDCDILVTTNARIARGIFDHDGHITASRTRIVATGASGENSGVVAQTGSTALQLHFNEVDVTADGGTHSQGLMLGSNGGDITINRGTVVSRSSNSAYGVALNGGSLWVQGTRVSATGANTGVGVAANARGTLTDVIAHGTSHGLLMDGLGERLVRGGHFTSAGTAFDGTGVAFDFPVQVERSFFEGARAIVFRPELQSLAIRSTVLAGERQLPATATCDKVYDGNYAPLNAQCR